MSDSVVARVADRLEIQPEQTDRVLRTLAQLIKKQSAREGRVRVPGLGIFQQTPDALVFEPDAALAEAVNHRFAGLETVPMTPSPEAEMEAPEDLEEEALVDSAEEEPAEEPESAEEESAKEPESAEEPESTEEPEQPFFEEEPVVEDEAAEEPEPTFFEEEPDAQDEAAEEREPAFFEEKPVVEDEAGKIPLYDPSLKPEDYDDPDISEAAAYEKLQESVVDTDEEASSEWAQPGASWSKDDLDTLIQDTVGEEKPVEEETTEEEPAAEEAALPEAEALPESEALTAEAEETKESEAALTAVGEGRDDRPPARPGGPRKEPQRRSMLPWILIGVVILMIGAGVLYQFGFFGSASTDPEPPPLVTDTPPADTPEPATPDPTTSAEDTPTPSDATDTPTETPTETPPPSGEGFDRSAGGYTVVLASFPERATAETEAERYRQLFSDQSIPVDVIQGESNGRAWYRVAVGQAPTVEEATALRGRLSSDLPEGSWVLRITPDS